MTPLTLPPCSALPDELGYDVQPATNTNFGLSEVVKSRLAAPYSSSCFSNWTQTNYTYLLGKWLIHDILPI